MSIDDCINQHPNMPLTKLVETVIKECPYLMAPYNGSDHGGLGWTKKQIKDVVAPILQSKRIDKLLKMNRYKVDITNNSLVVTFENMETSKDILHMTEMILRSLTTN